MSLITLVSMAPSGETFITRNAEGRLWLHQPEGAGGAGWIDEHVADLAVAKHGFDLVEKQFDSWELLDDERLRRAESVTPAVIVDLDALDAEDISGLLAAGRRWLVERRWERAHQLGTNLLGVRVVIGDPTLLADVKAFLEEAGRAHRVGLRAPAHPRHLARWREVVPPLAPAA